MPACLRKVALEALGHLYVITLLVGATLLFFTGYVFDLPGWTSRRSRAAQKEQGTAIFGQTAADTTSERHDHEGLWEKGAHAHSRSLMLTSEAGDKVRSLSRVSWQPSLSECVVVKDGFQMDKQRVCFADTSEAFASCVQALLDWHAKLQACMQFGFVRWRAFVLYCNERISCWGLGDRLRGFVLALYAAALTGRALLIHHSKPLPLVWFLEPNNLNWTLPTELESSIDKMLWKVSSKEAFGGKNCKEGAMELTRLRENVVRLLINRQVRCAMYMVQRSAWIKPGKTGERGKLKFMHFFSKEKARASRLAYTHLFSFSSRVKEAYAAWMGKKAILQPSCSVCMHVRKGGKMGYRREVEEPRVANVTGVFACSLRTAAELQQLSHCKKQPVLFIAVADNNGSLNELRRLAELENMPLVMSNLAVYVLHLDRMPVVTDWELFYQSTLRVFVDFYALSQCSAMVRSGRGNFNVQAGMFRPTPVEKHLTVEADGQCVPDGCNIKGFCTTDTKVTN